MFYPRPRLKEPVPWLGGLTSEQFMKKHWQKKPLLVRQAFTNFKPAVSIKDVQSLCQDPNASSRLVKFLRKKNSWVLEHGPLTAKQIPSMSSPDWTILVQQVNTHLPAADRFLDAFRFIPQARLDDLMISIAGPQGGVGPHVDSYDVFLIQASGKRRWQIAKTKEVRLREDAPLKILSEFNPQADWLLEPGDMLYLPPGVAHQGDAVGADCMTWSVGFRAPNRPSLADLIWADHLESIEERQWRDPGLAATEHPAKIPSGLIKQLTKEFLASLPKARAVALSVSKALSEPAPDVFFKPPGRPASAESFIKNACQKGIRLHPASRLLYYEGEFFANGELIPAAENPRAVKFLKKFADTRQLGPGECVSIKSMHELSAVLYDMYRAGWIVYD